MSFRYQKRVNLGKGAGLNLSKTGVSYSQRTKYGSIGSKGFSLRTGIPGLTFRTNWGKGGAGLVTWVIMGGVILACLVVYNLLRLLWFIVTFVYNKIRSKA